MDPKQMEEERRLCYVGITRAKEHLYFTHTERRMQYGKTSNNTRNRFLNDVPDHLLQLEGQTYQDRVTRPSSSWGNKRKSNKSSRKRHYVPLDDAQLDSVLSGEMDIDSFLDD
jgi:DNA helicase-2/ATP-dependent DNA helicase PcrA